MEREKKNRESKSNDNYCVIIQTEYIVLYIQFNDVKMWSSRSFTS